MTVNLGSTAAQTIAPGLTLQLSDANGLSDFIGTAFSDTIYGNARSNLLQGADSFDNSYQPNAPGVGANGKLQVVLLDFDTAYNQANGVYNFDTFYATAGVTSLRAYTPAERQAILQTIETDYAPFMAHFNSTGQLTQGGIYFTTNPSDPLLLAAGTNFITEFFDQSVPAGGDEPTSPTGAIASPQFEPGGTSTDLDFRDADMMGTASIQVNGIVGEPLQPPDTETNWITLSAKIAAHELGHLLGLHHADSFGPIGDGTIPLPAGANYNPVYTGPIDANETFDHIITSGDSVGADRWNDLRDVFFGEREDVVLAFSFAAPATPSDPRTVAAATPSLFVEQQQTPTKPISQTSAQPLYPAPLSVPNTEVYGRDAGATFETQAVDVQGSIGLVDGQAEQDYYSLTGNAGDVINVNVMSQGITRIDNLGPVGYIDPVVFLYKVNTDGKLIQVAYNDDVFAASANGDASLVDVVLPTSGSYVIKVTSFSYAGEGALDGVTTPTQAEIQAAAGQIADPAQRANFVQNTDDAVNGTDTGNYELFVYRFKAGVTTSGADTFVPGSGPAMIVGGAANGDVLQNAQGANFSAFVNDTRTFTVANVTGLSGSGNYAATINWGDGSSSSGTVRINGNQITIQGSHPYAASGTYSFSVAIAEDAVAVDVTGQATVINSLATTTAVTSSTQNNTSTYGQTVTFNATIVTNPAGSGTPTGSVDFVDATTGQDLGAFTLQNGAASVGVSSLAAESHSIQAHYIADSGFDLTSSGSLTQTTNPATLLVTANNASRAFGQANPLFTANITGFVNSDPSTVVSGVAGLTTTVTTTSPAGVYPILATQGTLNAANYTFTFVSGTLTVQKDDSSTAASASLSTPSYGQAEKFTAVITDVLPGTGTPTGSVDFTDTSTGVDLGSVSLSSGVATFTTSSLPVGSNTITETYLGDGNFNSSSSTIVVTVKQSVIVLDPSASGALNLSSNAHVTFGGNVTVDSSSTSALTTSGNAIVSAAGIQIVGGFIKGANDQFTPMPTTGAAALANPVGTFTLPSLIGLTNYGAVNVVNPTTLNPGSYTSISISSNGTVALNSGTYLILGGGFTESSNANVTASGVTFVIEGGGFNMSGNAILTGGGDSIFNTTTTNTSSGTAGALNVSGNSHLNITGPTTGPNAGVVIYQPSFNTQVLTFSGNAIAGLTEAIIAPGAQLALTGNANVNAALVVKQLAMSGNATAQVHANALPTAGLTPAQVRTAYGFSQIALGTSGQLIAGAGSGQTIAIVDAFDDPTIAADLQQFDKTFGLEDASFTKAMPDGTPSVNAGWSEEIALDVEWAHAIAPGAKILLVEAPTASVQDLLQAVDYARQQPGVVAVSMSWATNEFAGETALDSYFTTPANHSGVTFVAAAGDSNAVS